MHCIWNLWLFQQIREFNEKTTWFRNMSIFSPLLRIKLKSKLTIFWETLFSHSSNSSYRRTSPQPIITTRDHNYIIIIIASTRRLCIYKNEYKKKTQFLPYHYRVHRCSFVHSLYVHRLFEYLNSNRSSLEKLWDLNAIYRYFLHWWRINRWRRQNIIV